MKMKKLFIVAVVALGLTLVLHQFVTGAAQDAFNPAFSAHDAPPTHGFAADAFFSDSTELPFVTRSLWVGTGGDLVVVYKDDTVAVPLKNVPSGSPLSRRIKQIKSTGTTATNVVGEY